MTAYTLVDLGAKIRAAREEASLDINELASRIKVSPRILTAIEAGAEDDLPHAVYARGFVKSYALSLGFPEAEINSVLDEIYTEAKLLNINPDMGTEARAQAMNPHNNLALAAGVFVIVLVLAAVGFGGWFVVDRYGTDIWEFIKKPFSASSDVQVSSSAIFNSPGAQGGQNGNAGGGSGEAPNPSLAARQTAENSGQTGAHSAMAPPGAASSTASATAAASSGGVSTSGGNTTDAANASNTANNLIAGNAPGTASGSATEPVAGQSSARHTLVILLSEECWTAYSKDGAEGGTPRIKPGEEYSISFDKSLKLRLGRPEAVKQLVYDGVPHPIQFRPGSPLTLTFPPAP